MKNLKHPPILRASIAALLSLALGHITPAHATTLFWTGGGGDNRWENALNWNPQITPATDPTLSILIFGNQGPTLTFNDSNGAVLPFLSPVLGALTSAPNAPAYTHTGFGITMNSGSNITNNSPNLMTLAFINDPFLGGVGIVASSFDYSTGIFPLPSPGIPVTIDAASGNILITSNIGFEGANATLIFTGARDTNVTGNIIDLGPGGTNVLVKNGSGTVRLTGRSTYLGSTTVNAGTLLVDGSIASRNTFVYSTGTLGGIGFIGGNVFNAGNVAPGNSPGTLTIGGDYTQTKNGTLTIEIAGKKDGQHDLLAVQGRADLSGTLRLVKVGKGPRLNVGDTFTIVSAGQGVHGDFDKVKSFSTGTIVELGVVYEKNRVLVEAQQGSYKKFANKFRLTVNQRAVAGGLDKVAFKNQQPKLIRYLNERPLVELAGDFDKIAAEELTSIFTIGTALANIQTANLQRRTADLRSGSNGFSAQGFHAAGSGPTYSGGFGVAGPTGNEGKESKKMFVPAEENRWGAFLTGVGEWVDVDGDGNARGYDVTTGGFTLGLDYKVTSNFAVGISAGYAGTGADLTNNGRVFVNGGKLGVYATYFDGGFYVDGAVNGGYNSYDTRRNSLAGTARGDTDGGELNALIGSGYDWKVGALSIGPTASFQYTYVGIDSFTERGSLAPLTFRSQGSESLRSALGFKASYDWQIGGVVIKPEIRAAWQHEYGDDATKLDASFNNGGGNLFTVQGPEVGRDSMLVGAGVAVLFNERTSTYVYYDGEFFRDNYEAHNVSGGVRLAF